MGADGKLIDPLEIFIASAHSKGLEIHGWFNPYRVGSPEQLNAAPADSCVGKWRDKIIKKREEKSFDETSPQFSQPDLTEKAQEGSLSFTKIADPEGEPFFIVDLDADGNPKAPSTGDSGAPEGHIPSPNDSGSPASTLSSTSDGGAPEAVIPESDSTVISGLNPEIFSPDPILIHKGAVYLNPSSKEIQKTFVAAIEEFCQNYDIDGVHFDDYFYPVLNDNDPQLSFDKSDWEKSGSTKNISQWRRDNVSDLVKAVYSAVHQAEKGLVFGISPAGNFANIVATNHYLIDIDLWLSSDSYIDYIMPQIYWGFEPRASDGSLRPWAFNNCLETWKSHLTSPTVTLYVGLALYKAGTDSSDGNEVSEWLRFNDIISRQILATREDPVAQGFVIFDYRDLLRDSCEQEVENIRKVFQ